MPPSSPLTLPCPDSTHSPLPGCEVPTTPPSRSMKMEGCTDNTSSHYPLSHYPTFGKFNSLPRKSTDLPVCIISIYFCFSHHRSNFLLISDRQDWRSYAISSNALCRTVCFSMWFFLFWGGWMIEAHCNSCFSNYTFLLVEFTFVNAFYRDHQNWIDSPVNLPSLLPDPVFFCAVFISISDRWPSHCLMAFCAFFVQKGMHSAQSAIPWKIWVIAKVYRKYVSTNTSVFRNRTPVE